MAQPSQRAPRSSWAIYLMEAAELGTFMLSACVFTVLLEHPASPVRAAVADAFARRALIGLAMGATAVALVYSAWGRQSGAHFNPCVTLTFYRLGKIRRADAIAYVIAHFIGGAAGVAAAAVLLGSALAHPAVAFAVTVPGTAGTTGAFAAELAISFGLMTAVLAVSNLPRVERFTGLIAGALVATYITLEAPLSGMSMNPARTVASALFAGCWTGAWLYFAAPMLGMLLAAEAYVRVGRRRAVHCAKLRHDARVRCHFCEPLANYGPAAFDRPPPTPRRAFESQHATAPATASMPVSAAASGAVSTAHVRS